MQLILNFDRRNVLKIAAATGLALALAGAVGSAIAMSPIVTPPIKWAGGMEFVFDVEGGPFVAVSVPAGRNLILTDLVLGNVSGAAALVEVFSGAAGACEATTLRMHNIVVPNNATTSVALQTGIGFASGQAICMTTSRTVSVNGRGFFFTPAPPS